MTWLAGFFSYAFCHLCTLFSEISVTVLMKVLKWTISFLLLSFKVYLYMLDINSLLDVFLQIFFSQGGLSSSSLWDNTMSLEENSI